MRVPKKNVSIYLDNPDRRLLNHYIQNDTVLFPIHPEIFEDDLIDFINELRKFSFTSICVSPTASTRTVLTMETNNVQHHFIKLHYPRRISRFIRRLRENTIQNCILASEDLENFSLENFAYLPETIGMTYGSGPDSWGFIIRETTPRPNLEKRLTFHKFFPDSNLYFKNRTFYYMNEIFSGNKQKIVETNDPPRWR